MPKAITRKQKRAARYQQVPEEAPKLGPTLETIKSLTESQTLAIEDFEDGYNLFLYGYAGTGKTYLGLGLGLDAVVNKKTHERVVIFRNVVPTRDMGFLPGSQKDKAAVYEQPYIENCAKLFGRSDAYSWLKTKKMVEFSTTSFIRGITLDNCIILIDEFQNMSWPEFYSLLTRVGRNSRIIICGDIRQKDLTKETSCFAKFMKVELGSFSDIEFGKEDIVRGNFAKEFIIACEELEDQEA
jgi:predicted ribonuclease YlaK